MAVAAGVLARGSEGRTVQKGHRWDVDERLYPLHGYREPAVARVLAPAEGVDAVEVPRAL